MYLEFNEDYCTKLIAPKQIQRPAKIKNDPTYWYADFEADTSVDIHKPYIFVVQNQKGTLCEEFRGEKCTEKLLDYLPNEAIVYFHNLAYDTRFLAAYGME